VCFFLWVLVSGLVCIVFVFVDCLCSGGLGCGDLVLLCCGCGWCVGWFGVVGLIVFGFFSFRCCVGVVGLLDVVLGSF